MAHGQQKNVLDFGGNPDHIMLGLETGTRLRLWLTFHFIPRRTVLRLADG